jgi:hypothetical protein
MSGAPLTVPSVRDAQNHRSVRFDPTSAAGLATSDKCQQATMHARFDMKEAAN